MGEPEPVCMPAQLQDEGGDSPDERECSHCKRDIDLGTFDEFIGPMEKKFSDRTDKIFRYLQRRLTIIEMAECARRAWMVDIEERLVALTDALQKTPYTLPDDPPAVSIPCPTLDTTETSEPVKTPAHVKKRHGRKRHGKTRVYPVDVS
jgi:hypothetical protein